MSSHRSADAPSFLGFAAGMILLGAGWGSAAGADAGIFHPEAGRPALRSYSPADYAGNSQTWAMWQREDGVRLFGFYGGIAEYDGARWSHLHSMLGSFRGFAQTPDGRIYFTASADVGWIGHEPDGALRLESIMPALPPEAVPAGPFAELAVFRGKLHLSTTKGVVRWDGAKVDRFWPLPGATTARLNLVGDRLWFRRMGTTEVFELRDDEWVKVVDDPALKGKVLHLAVAAGDGAPVVGVEPGGLFRPGAEGRLVPWPTPADSILAQAQLYSAASLRDGSIAIGTYSDGLVLISPDGRRARQVTMHDGLPSNVIQGIGADRDGRLWLCTFNGIATLEWPPAYTLFDRRDSLDASMIRSLRRYDGRLYFGGLGGLSAIETAQENSAAAPRVVRVSSREIMNSDPVPHPAGAVHGGAGGLKTIREGQVGIVLPLQDNIIFLEAALENPDRIIFAGQKGLGSAIHRDGAWHLEGYAANFGQATTVVHQMPGGRIFARGITGDGWRLDVPRGKDGAPDWANVRPVPFSEIPGWLKERSNDWWMTPAPAGLTFFTKDGILVYSAEKGAFVPDTFFDRTGTPPGPLYALLQEPESIWGVVHPEGRRPGGRNAMGRFVYPSGTKARWIPLREDVAATVGALAAHEVVADPANPGIYWLRGLGAVMRLDLQRLEEPPPPAAPLLRRISRGDGALPLPGGTAPIRLPWARSALSFQFAAPLSGFNSLRFEHRLVGWDDAWSAPAPARESTFTGLGAGSYVYEVRERDAQGRTGPVLRVPFAILPPWWQTSWAWAAYALLVLGAFAALYYGRVAALQHRRRVLEALVAQRTAELRAEKERADQASKAKSTFLAHMSHELRTPLNGIIGYAQVLLKDATVAGPQRERVNIVHASGQHLLRMINEVLDFSKIEAGKIERRDETVHFGQLLRELAVAHEAAAHSRGLAFALAQPADLPLHVTGDGQKLRQILDNLLSNAVKFTKQGRVDLRVEHAGGDTWRFTVADTGVGLQADDVARLFQPFEQARRGRPTEPGTGLGLAITQRLVRLLGGDLQVASEPGRGSSFTFAIALPAIGAPRSASRSPFPVRGYSGPRRRIAVVDDHAVNRSLLRDLLEPLGFEIAEFEDAESMLAVPPGGLAADLAFLDVKLPGMDGLELARRLRERTDTRKLPIVFTSASVLTFDHATATALGCPEFLPKPFAEKQLNDLLTRLLDLQWQRASAERAPAAAAGPLPAALVADLLAQAESGDIAALRGAVAAALAAHPGHVTLKQVETAAASYQLEAVRQLLRAAANA